MTRRRAIRDVPTSVRQRLLNLARQRGLRFESVLQRFAVERFLYRLSASNEVDRFTLKGAALLRMWAGQELRPTRDIDFLARGGRDEAAIRNALRDICGVPCREDGVVFDPVTITIAASRSARYRSWMAAMTSASSSASTSSTAPADSTRLTAFTRSAPTR